MKVHTEAVISDGLVSWLLIFGDAAEVIAPNSLRDMIRDKVERIIKLYNNC